ncbi:MAG: hypothetical protein AAGD34_14425 [Pseudomonadota bacterium]
MISRHSLRGAAAAAAFAASIFVAAGGAFADTDRDDPSATAEAFLTAYKARDLVAMAPLMNEVNQEMFQELAAAGENHPRYKSIFSGWRAEAVDGWTGTLGTVRYNNGQALVPFAEANDETIIVVLDKEDAGWAVEDVNSPSTGRFNRLPTSP